MGARIRRTGPALAILLALLGCTDFLGSGGEDRTNVLRYVSPAPGQGDVSVLSQVALGFSRDVDEQALIPSVTLWAGARRVTTSADVVGGGRVLVLRPKSPLDFGTVYRVEISGLGDAWDFSGGPPGRSWEFTTEGMPPPALNADSLAAHLGALAHDSMRGRGSGSSDEMRAAEYLKARFLSYGLREPLAGAIQPFEAYSSRLDAILASRNVLAVMDGWGSLAEEWIAVGAHYDHIGFRGLPDETQGPNNGADDNASGAVTVLELARVLQEQADAGGFGTRDRRSILFIGFGAEEHGLLGSCSYVYGAPVAPLAQTKAMLNFDMVGRLREDAVFLAGGETSWTWSTLVADANQAALNPVIPNNSCTGCTDHVCFWQAGVPFMGFSTGTHEQYHSPEDDVDLINFLGMVRVGDLAVRMLTRLLVMPDPPNLASSFPQGG